MGKKEPAWKAYEKAIISFIPRLEGGSEELEHRARLLWSRDWATTKRSSVDWHADQLLCTIISLSSAYAISTKVRPEQARAVWESVVSLLEVAGKLQACDLT